METTKYIVTVITCIVIGIAIGLWMKPNPLATIHLSNESGKTVTSVNITIGMTSYVLGDIPPQSGKSVNVVVAGEAGYSLKANFAGGDTLMNWNYIEPGSSVVETIHDTKIVSAAKKQ